jgi:hypothetical protein
MVLEEALKAQESDGVFYFKRQGCIKPPATFIPLSPLQCWGLNPGPECILRQALYH